MSGRWDWDVKSSYTYHALKKAKDVVEKSLNQAAEEIQDSERKKSQNPPENGMPHQQPPYQAEGDRPTSRLRPNGRKRRTPKSLCPRE